MIEDVIVTVTCSDGEFDMELPANIPLTQLKSAISEALAKKGANVPENFKFIGNGNDLNDSETLLDAGVWDGSNLTIVQKDT